MPGTLYICGTPIGNLEDVTFRQLSTFRSVDFIACEDTRHTLRLLNHYGISKKLISYHAHNYKTRGKEIIGYMEEGMSGALVSDAGMPCISDPGADIVRMCRISGIKVTAVPGPVAFASAFALSGIGDSAFMFCGFFPKDKKGQKKVITKLSSVDVPYVFYEAPHRLIKTLALLREFLSDKRNVTVARELTKVHEQVKSGTLAEMAEYYSSNEPRGEIVLIIEGAADEGQAAGGQRLPGADIRKCVEAYTAEGLDLRDSMKKVAKEQGISKRDVYKIYINENRF